jgi:feruloyl esterase
MRLTTKLGLPVALTAAVAGAALLLAAGTGATEPAASTAPRATAGTPVAAAMACADVRAVDFGAAIGLPVSIASATLNGTGAAEQCRVVGWIGQQTQFELRLPTTTWEGRYLQLGCGGTCGSIAFGVSPAGDTQYALTDNKFAVASTNEGHVSTGPWDVWAAGGDRNPLRENYGHLANHQVAVVSKEILARYYGQSPAFAYFQGYSDGGRAAIMEAQRYPEDFDGVIAGAPAIYTQESLTAQFIWRGIQGSKLDTPARQALAAAAMAACDPADGVADNQISDPRHCSFDPATIRCSATLTTNCLTPEQVDAARKQYRGATTESGKLMHPGGLPEGSELNWPTSPGTLPSSYGRYIAYKDDPAPDWTWEDFEFTESSFNALQHMAKVYDADNDKKPDLGEFDGIGGKLIVWYGLADASTGEQSALDWYSRMAQRAGGVAQAKSFARLFQVPGLYHGGGYINYSLSLLPKLVAWVEAATPPEVVVASATTPVPRTYPAFVYPARARYTGSGSVYDAANWTRQDPASEPDDRVDWLGGKGPKAGK